MAISVDEYINSIVATLPAPPPEYLSANPFYFDEQAAREVATAEYEPYYKEMLDDYMTDVDTTKQRIGEDKTKFLKELNTQKQLFLERNGDSLSRMIRGIQEGYEGKGLYFSGRRNWDEETANKQNSDEVQDYMRSYKNQTDEQNTTAARNLADLATKSDRYARDIEREKQGAIESQVGKIKDEKLNQYLYGMSKYYGTDNWGSMI